MGGLQTEIHRNTEIQKFRNTARLYTISTMSSLGGWVIIMSTIIIVLMTIIMAITGCLATISRFQIYLGKGENDMLENERGERGRKEGEWTKGGRVASRLLYLDKPGIS